MVNGQFTILGSRTNPADDYRYQLDVTPEGAIPISGNVGINGNIVIGSVTANVDSIYVQSGANLTGSMIELETIPTAGVKNNPSWSLVYDADGNVSNVYQMIGTGSYVNTITWTGFSGTLPGTGSRVTNISAWSVV